MRYKISIILPVWNERFIINDILDRLSAQRSDGGFEVIVVDGSPEGETINAVQKEEVKKVIAEKGRAKQMNKGASLASGEVLLFLHADTVLPDSALRRISSAMEKGDFVGGAFDLGIQSHRPVFRLIENAASLRSRITRMPYGDQAIFVRKEYFDAIGGFREIPLMEDVELMRRIKRSGDKILIIDEKVLTSPRRWEKEGILSCTLRNWILITLYFLGVPPDKLAKFYK